MKVGDIYQFKSNIEVLIFIREIDQKTVKYSFVYPEQNHAKTREESGKYYIEKNIFESNYDAFNEEISKLEVSARQKTLELWKVEEK